MRTYRVAAIALVLLAAPAARSATIAKSPPWISIESPVNPYDASTRGALLLVHGSFRDGVPQLSDLRGTAEGVVKGARQTVALHFDSTGRPGVFALRRQWSTDGSWVLRISLRTTTALVTLDRDGEVAGTHVPLHVTAGGSVPRDISAAEIDSTLAAIARR